MDEKKLHNADAALSAHLFSNRETGFQYAPFAREIAFYESVRSGNLETVKTLFTPLGGEGFGVLSEDPLRNLKYHLIISIAMITRFCLSGGMLPAEAYSLSDVYIQMTDRAASADEIRDIHYEMTVEFTKRMRRLKDGKRFSKTMLQVLDYISDHLHERILIVDIADAVSRSVPYISRLFRREMGIPLSAYINRKKIETAAHMLLYSDYSALDISNFLGFSSQSYFIQQFKAVYHVTPKEYRDGLYSGEWMQEEHGGEDEP